MAFLFTDGFDSYAATADLTKKWTTAGSPWAWVANAGRAGGGAVQAVGGAGGGLLRTFAGVLNGTTSVAVGFWIKVSAAPTATATLLTIYNTGEGSSWNIKILTSGTLQTVNAIGGVQNTGFVNICDGNWHWIEWLLQATNANLRQALYVDSVPEWNFVQALSAFNFDHVVFSTIASRTLTIDDVVVFDNNNPAPTISSFALGPREILTLRPTADSAVQFTPDSGATNFNRVNEVNADGNASYVQDATSGQQDLYVYGDLPSSPASISGVMLNAYLQNPNGGTISFQQICKSGLVQMNGTGTIIPAAFRIVQQQVGVDPNTNAAWDFAGLNAATFGIKVV